MIPPRILRQIASWWEARCRAKRLAQIPGYRKAASELADRRRKHRPTRDIIEQRRALIHDNLRGA